MDELRDSVVSGRFNAVSSLVRVEAAGGPEGLRARRGDRGKERRQEAGGTRSRISQAVLLQISLTSFALNGIFTPDLQNAVVAGWRGDTILTLCSVWGKCCSGRTRQHRRTHPRWKSRRSLAQSARGGECEPARQHRCWGLMGHSLTEKKKKNQT